MINNNESKKKKQNNIYKENYFVTFIRRKERVKIDM